MDKRNNRDNGPGTGAMQPWSWIPSLYFAEGLPLIIISFVSVILYKKMGVSNADIALFTGWLYLPWVLKGLWSPVIDNSATKRFWILLTQFLMGAGFACVAFVIPAPRFFQFTFAIFWLLAFNSATHDIAADGFYILGLDNHQQVWFSGIRNTFYRIAIITGQGLLVMFAGFIEARTGLETVNIGVEAVSEARASAQGPEFPKTESEQRPGPLRIVAVPRKEFQISLGRADNPEKVKAVIAETKKWNDPPGNEQTAEEEEEEVKEPEKSWWNRNVQKLGTSLRKFSGRDKIKNAEITGNIAICAFRMSAPPPPGKTVILNFGRKYGSKSISLIEGERREFTDKNWDRPLISVIQVDPRLENAQKAVFAATAGNVRLSWVAGFILLAVIYTGLAFYHLVRLPKPALDRHAEPGAAKQFFANFAKTFGSFFTKKGVCATIAFLLLYRLGEAQLVKLATPFLLDSQEAGGLALATGEVGFVYGTVGVICLTLGGLIGAFLAARFGLKKMMWPMVCAINLPNLVYVFLSMEVPDSFFAVNVCVAVEQFGYGIGFTGYMLYMVYFAEDSTYKTSHYAIMTGFMALGMMLPGMVSGWIQEQVGYVNFFIWVLIATIPGFIGVAFLNIDPDFGKKKKKVKT